MPDTTEQALHVRTRGDDALRTLPLSRALLGTSPAIRTVVDLVTRVASTDATVLIHGASGTGKELVARTIHAISPRASGPFVAINCAAVPPPLIESELFGHARGAFTDAHEARTGLLVAASGGTIFLDEVGEMPLAMQSKLLRALQERTVHPVGGTDDVVFDARVITATHRDLDDDVHTKRFREDLYYRIAVVIIEVPTLRERVEDIPALAQYFVHHFADRFGKPVAGIAPTALATLMAHPWPGNVRELENSIERAVALTRDENITVDDLPERVRAQTSTQLPPLPQQVEDLLTLAEIDRRYIAQVLALVGGNKSRAARILGVDRRTLYRIFDRERHGVGSPPDVT